MIGTAQAAGALRVRAAEPTDEPAVVELLESALGTGPVPRSRDYWRWKHVENPWGGSPVLLAEAEGRVVGLRAFMCWRWRSRSTEAVAVRAVDTATAAAWRGRGIFRQLTMRLRDEVLSGDTAFVFNTPNAQSRPGYLKMGWSVVGRPTVWARLVRPGRLAAAIARHRLRGGEREPPSADAPTAHEVLADPAIAELVDWRRAVACVPLHTALNEASLRWRYAAVPGIGYHALMTGAGSSRALIVFRTRHRGGVSEVRVCEMLAGPSVEARRNMRRLLREVLRTGAYDLAIAMPGGDPALRRALFGAGYVPAPHVGPILTVCTPAGALTAPDPRRLADWAPSIGDLELF